MEYNKILDDYDSDKSDDEEIGSDYDHDIPPYLPKYRPNDRPELKLLRQLEDAVINITKEIVCSIIHGDVRVDGNLRSRLHSALLALM